MNLSPNYVESYVSKIFKYLNCSSIVRPVDAPSLMLFVIVIESKKSFDRDAWVCK